MMFAQQDDTIVAIATPPGRGAVGIVRVSGKDLADAVRHLFGRELNPREATYLSFRDDKGDVIDHVLAIYFKGPNSYTGEDVLEIQAHGGSVVLQMVMNRCLQLDKLLSEIRIAKPGEFTQRAYLNHKLDLAQAEAVADLIDASTEVAARGASRSLSGDFSKEIYSLRDALIRLRMLVEATLDFPEEDIDFLKQANAIGQLANLQAHLDKVLKQTQQGVLLKEGIRIVIAGQPNAGKSSLLNALAGAELAIVTPIAGTTRDVVQEEIQIEGIPLHIIDTAGLRDLPGIDEVEKIGIARAWGQIKQADVILFLHDASKKTQPLYLEEDEKINLSIKSLATKQIPVLNIWNKSDLVEVKNENEDTLVLSAKTGEGLENLRQKLLQLVGWRSGGSEGLYMARERHLQALREVEGRLKNAKKHMDADNAPLDLMAEELRLAQNGLNQITGEFTSDDLLGVIFSSFCIGK